MDRNDMTTSLLHRRWPALIMATGFLGLGFATLFSSGLTLFFWPTVWFAASVAVASLLVLNAFGMYNDNMIAAVMLAFATFRIGDFILVDRWTGVFVWIVIGGLVMAVWRARSAMWPDR